MRKFSRYWTLELQTTSDDFRKAFCSLVPAWRDREIRLVSTWDFRLGRDYFGTMRQETFDLWRRDDYRSRNDESVMVKGKMIPSNNQLVLELKVERSSLLKYMRCGFLSLFGSPIASAFLNGFINLFSSSRYYSIPDWVLITELIVMYVLVFYGLVKLEHYYVDRRVKDFNRILRIIEQAAKAD